MLKKLKGGLKPKNTRRGPQISVTPLYPKEKTLRPPTSIAELSTIPIIGDPIIRLFLPINRPINRLFQKIRKKCT